MNDENRLRQFVEKVMSIQAPGQNLFGGGIPGMGGSSGPANQAASTGGGDTVEKLKRETIELARMQSHSATAEDIALKVKDVEGLLLISSVLSVITETETNTLLDELHGIFD